MLSKNFILTKQFALSRLLILFSGLYLVSCQSPNVKAVKNSEATSEKSVAMSDSSPHSIFQPLSTELPSQTKVPILLPKNIPESDNPQLVALLENVDESEYEVMLAFDQNCNGGTACYLGKIKGKLANEELQLKGIEVTLANNIPGYFVDAACGANCSDSNLAWMEQGNLYQVAIQGGNLQTLIEVANSMTNVHN